MANSTPFDPNRPGNPFDNDDGTPYDGGEARADKIDARRKERARKEAQEIARSSLPSWNPFPVDVFPPSVTQYIKAAAHAIDCDPSLIAHPSLALLSAAVANSHRIKIRNTWIEPAHGWFMVVNASGGGKSPAQAAALRPLECMTREEQNRHKGLVAEYEEEMHLYNNAPKESKGKKPKRPSLTRYKVGDTTYESLLSVHRDNPRGLLLNRGEIGGWISSFDQYKQGHVDLQNWIETHDGHPITRDRKSDGAERGALYLNFPSITVIGGIQPETLRRIIKDSHISSGFFARMLVLMPPRRTQRWRNADVTDEILFSYERIIRSIYALEFAGEPQILCLDPEAEKLFIDFVNDTAEQSDRLPDGALRAMTVKLKSTAARLALVLHIAHQCESRSQIGQIDARAMAAAIKLTLWYRAEAFRVYRFIGLDEAGSADERKARDLPELFTREDVEKTWKVKRRQAYNVISRLEEGGLIKKKSHGQYINCTFYTSCTFDQNNNLSAEIQRILDMHQNCTNRISGDGFVQNAEEVQLNISPPSLAAETKIAEVR